MKNIKWYNLDQNGYIIEDNVIIRPLLSQAAIYVYKFSLDGKEKLYIGSTVNLVQRFRQHKYRAEIYSSSKKEIKYRSILYNYVAKYGWENFTFGVIEYIDFELYLEWEAKKEILLKAEQSYLDTLSPELNINKKAGSMLGYKHDRAKVLEQALERRGKTYKRSQVFISLKPAISKETIIKLKLHTKDITVSIYDKEYTLVKEFNRIKKAAEFVGLSPSSVSGYIKNGKLWNDLYYFKLKVNTKLNEDSLHFPLDENVLKNQNPNKKNKHRNSYSLEVHCEDKVIYKFSSIREGSLFLNISKYTITKYSVGDMLWKNKFRFKLILNL